MPCVEYSLIKQLLIHFAMSYTQSLALQFAKRRIINPLDTGSGEHHYEHHVGSWACTILKDVFGSPHWIITPERRDDYTNKRPDFVVEKLEGNTATYHLVMELKSNDKRIRFEDAVIQTVEHISQTMEHRIECFVIVQCGRRIGFFEYHNDVGDLDEEEIPHFKGCVSVTQKYPIKGNESKILTDVPEDLLPLYHNYKRLRKKTDNREEAARYEEKCVFDLENHEREIDFLFEHMANNAPRSSV